ncbi:SH3 domain-containing protein [Anaerococcus hydrogenalis]|uniref:SH3 domain protein n=2 Tax=Anaerococcus hydrogenalis TaxID=33029 RepID=B6W7B5_9FIRM|nr:SH3 domain-containing protein [Anaerococcus hydrogenalis]EEB36658.1 SH3 domain protein [Anaerococcus hydrogenalis DSM 7454]MBS5989515.1 SH3 domain-containing protein [Anaerococcus hydrogenalis]MDK7695426.1 SH3 domain-containing protein [Anaerococcus hydrogenalis]MDK7697185.1 SH3 domain-containing protein [Anaerococcus hydrogenalis]MDK7708294.1 SH3 domain-containing protein [Anaerococcus hydrogenalis]
MKKKILLILALSLTLSACKKDQYVSQRHPDENKSNPVSTSVSYQEEKNKENKIVSSDSKKASLEKVDDKNKSNEKKEDKKETKKEVKKEEKTEDKDKEVKEAVGTFTVKDISNIRRETNEESEIVATIQPGVEVERSEIDGKWSKVSYDQYQGYILTELLTDIQ